jgi:anti-sigma regulatory factor (Ser/Thr protein kinase)
MTQGRIPQKWNLIQIIPSVLCEVDHICQMIRQILTEQALEALYFKVDLLTREFVNNAILHGNQCQPDKRVCVRCHIGRRWLCLQIIDEGPGFDWRGQRKILPSENSVSGRGLAIGAIYANRMVYNHCGNQVTLWIDKKEAQQGER